LDSRTLGSEQCRHVGKPSERNLHVEKAACSEPKIAFQKRMSYLLRTDAT
jgi:hypothetical protein